jgi:hypothetical protein
MFYYSGDQVKGGWKPEDYKGEDATASKILQKELKTIQLQNHKTII